MKASGKQTVFWWIVWIAFTIGAFFLAAAIWSPVINRAFGSIRETRASVMWVTAVFGTWIVFLVPLIVVMYQKVDKAYEDARIAREKKNAAFRAITIERAKRMLPERWSSAIRTWPETIRGGHLVTVTTRTQKRFENVFVQNADEILGIYNETRMPFEISEITGVEPADLNRIPQFRQNLWLRLDGIDRT